MAGALCQQPPPGLRGSACGAPASHRIRNYFAPGVRPDRSYYLCPQHAHLFTVLHPLQTPPEPLTARRRA